MINKGMPQWLKNFTDKYASKGLKNPTASNEAEAKLSEFMYKTQTNLQSDTFKKVAEKLSSAVLINDEVIIKNIRQVEAEISQEHRKTVLAHSAPKSGEKIEDPKLFIKSSIAKGFSATNRLVSYASADGKLPETFREVVEACEKKTDFVLSSDQYEELRKFATETKLADKAIPRVIAGVEGWIAQQKLIAIGQSIRNSNRITTSEFQREADLDQMKSLKNLSLQEEADNLRMINKKFSKDKDPREDEVRKMVGEEQSTKKQITKEKGVDRTQGLKKKAAGEDDVPVKFQEMKGTPKGYGKEHGEMPAGEGKKTVDKYIEQVDALAEEMQPIKDKMKKLRDKASTMGKEELGPLVEEEQESLQKLTKAIERIEDADEVLIRFKERFLLLQKKYVDVPQEKKETFVEFLQSKIPEEQFNQWLEEWHNIDEKVERVLTEKVIKRFGEIVAEMEERDEDLFEQIDALVTDIEETIELAMIELDEGEAPEDEMGPVEDLEETEQELELAASLMSRGDDFIHVASKEEFWLDKPLLGTTNIQLVSAAGEKRIVTKEAFVKEYIPGNGMTQLAANGQPNDIDKCRDCAYFHSGEGTVYYKCASCIHAYTEEELDAMGDDVKELSDHFTDRGISRSTPGSADTFHKKHASLGGGASLKKKHFLKQASSFTLDSGLFNAVTALVEEDYGEKEEQISEEKKILKQFVDSNQDKDKPVLSSKEIDAIEKIIDCCEDDMEREFEAATREEDQWDHVYNEMQKLHRIFSDDTTASLKKKAQPTIAPPRPEAPVETPPQTPETPDTNDPFTPSRPAVIPRPKQLLSSRQETPRDKVVTAGYDDEAIEAVKNFWNQIPEDHPWSKHPIFTKHGGELSKEAFEYLQGKTGEGMEEVVQRTYEALEKIQQIEAEHKENLERLAKAVVVQIYGIDEKMLEPQLGESASQDEPHEVERVEITPELQEQINKRITMNTISQGSALHGLVEAHNIVNEALKQISPELLELYTSFGAGTNKLYWMYDLSQMVDQLGEAEVGESHIEYDDQDQPKVVGTGVIFPVLVQELIKGVMELLSFHGLKGLNEQELATIYDHSDRPQDEQWQIQAGPSLWRKFVKLLPANVPLAKVIMAFNQQEPHMVHQIIEDVITNPDQATQILARITEGLAETPDAGAAGEVTAEKKSHSAPSGKPPKKWWDSMVEEVKKDNPEYSSDQVNKTVGAIWSGLSDEKKTEIRGREGKAYKKPEKKAGDASTEALRVLGHMYPKTPILKLMEAFRKDIAMIRVADGGDGVHPLYTTQSPSGENVTVTPGQLAMSDGYATDSKGNKFKPQSFAPKSLEEKVK